MPTLDYASAGSREVRPAGVPAPAWFGRLTLICCGLVLWGAAGLPGDLLLIVVTAGVWLLTALGIIIGGIIRFAQAVAPPTDEERPPSRWGWWVLATVGLMWLGVPARLTFLVALPWLHPVYAEEPMSKPVGHRLVGPFIVTGGSKQPGSGLRLRLVGGGIVLYTIDSTGALHGRVMFTSIGPPLVTGESEYPLHR
jgi:hypothetical protein